MRKIENRIWSAVIRILTIVTLFLLAFVIYFIVREALPLFVEVPVKDFLFGTRWMPVDYTGDPSFGIFHFILGTIVVSFTAMIIALFVGLGTAVYLSCGVSEKTRKLCYPFIDLLAGIPSVVYGFIGITVVVKYFIKAGVHTGVCVLAAAVVLSVMLLPYLVSSCSDSITKVKDENLMAAEAMGISKWYAVGTLILPAAWKYIWMSMVLAIGRAMGETMAVMMVMGNANLFPRLLGKGESIAAVIALEMGTAVGGSLHYHALYGAGMVLMILLFLIQLGITFLQKKWI